MDVAHHPARWADASASSPFALCGRTALVTGAGTGIGRAISLALAAAGADLILLSEQENLDATAVGAAEMGSKVDCLRLDLGRQDRLSRIKEAFDGNSVDILVNNAGLIRRSPADEFTNEDWHDVIEVNLHAAFELSRAAGRGMLERGYGNIINIASLLSFQGGVFVSSYTASKHAIVGLTKALANEWAGRGVNVNAIAPGYVATATTEDLRADPRRAGEISARIPAGRWADPEDIAGAAVFLASPAAAYVHGHVLVVDGGWLAR
ncbi:SDR family oxidoreductase [Pseudonocardia acaciae]|uniref:SDR family oxidoreductase n=1 Tax=Pseudonocardia acaciae TaxID=551276 RepID=UPI00068914F2|nr:SDR family oxidoreductase [Pseudonocardia acaciae]